MIYTNVPVIIRVVPMSLTEIIVRIIQKPDAAGGYDRLRAVLAAAGRVAEADAVAHLLAEVFHVDGTDPGGRPVPAGGPDP